MPTNAVAESDNTLPDIVPPGTQVSLNFEHLQAQIAVELAAGLIDGEGVQQKYQLTGEQWEALRTNDIFRSMVADALQSWGGEMNAGQRITKKAEIILEDALPVLDEIAHNTLVPAASRIEAIKQMESLTGRKNKEVGAGGAGGGFILQINVGGKTMPGITIDSKATPVLEVDDE